MPVDFIISGTMVGIGGLGLVLISAVSESPALKITSITVLIVGAAAFHFS